MWLYSLPVVALFVITMAANLISQITKNSFVKKYASAADKYLFIAFGGIVSVAVLFLFGGIKTLSPFTVLTACGFGALTLIQSYFMLRAYDSGSFAYTSVIVSLSTIIPAFSGAIFWNETLYPAQIAGIVLLVLCFALCVGKDKEKKQMSVKWLACVILAFLSTGFIGVMQKVHQSSAYADELNGFLIISFLISALAAGICAVIALKRKKAEQNDNADGEEKPAKGVGYFLLIVLSGVGVALNNVINLYLSGKVDSAVFFPVVNGGGLILVTLCAVVLYREKLSVKQWAGIIVGIISVVLLSNP